jgi:cytochrome c
MRTALVSALVLVMAGAASAQDAESLFKSKCGNCHSATDADSTPEGPSLKGVWGRTIASLPDFDYSSGLKAKAGGHWTDAELDAYLAAPKTWAPGTSMFTAVPDPATRTAIIGYLKAQH